MFNCAIWGNLIATDYQLPATVRLAFANFDTDVAAVLYNITV